MSEPLSDRAGLYVILFYRDDRVLRRVPWDLGLATAITYARDHLAVRKADRVEVHDERGRTVFGSHLPIPGLAPATEGAEHDLRRK
jgi:hypothetical protein